MPRRYPAEFRLRAVALVRAGKTITSVATSLGVSQAALHGPKSSTINNSDAPPVVDESHS